MYVILCKTEFAREGVKVSFHYSNSFEVPKDSGAKTVQLPPSPAREPHKKELVAARPCRAPPMVQYGPRAASHALPTDSLPPTPASTHPRSRRRRT